MSDSPAEPRRVLGARTAFSDYVSVLAAKAGSAVISLGLALVTARLLAPGEYGIAAIFLILGLLLMTITSAWTATAVARYGREEYEARGRVVEMTWARVVISLPLLCASIGVIVALQAAGAFPAGFTWTLTWLAIAYGTASIVIDHLYYSLDASTRIKESAAWMIAQQLALVATFAAFLLRDVAVDATQIALGYVAWSAAFALLLCVRMRRLALGRPRHNQPLIRRVMVFSRPLMAFTVSQYVIRSVDIFVLGIFAGATATGLYAIAYQSYSVLQSLTIATGPVLVPLFVSLRKAGREDMISRYFDRVIAQMTLIGAVLAGFAAPLVAALLPVAFGERFADATEPLLVLLPAVVMIFVANLLAPILVLHERTREIGVVNVAAAAINVGLDFLLVGAFGVGIVGPAAATVAAAAVIMVVYLRATARCLGVKPHIHLVTMMLPAVAGAAPCLAIEGLRGWALAVGAVTMVTVVILVLVRPFSSADADLVSRLDIPAPLKRIALRCLTLGSPRRSTPDPEHA